MRSVHGSAAPRSLQKIIYSNIFRERRSVRFTAPIQTSIQIYQHNYDADCLHDGTRFITTSSKNAALEHQHNLRKEDVVVKGDFSHPTSKNRRVDGGFSIRDRLRQWRRENEAVCLAGEVGDPDLQHAPRVASTQVHIGPPNSLGGQEDLDESSRDVMKDHPGDLFGEYEDDYELSSTNFNPGDLGMLNVPGTGSSGENLCIFVRVVDGQRQFITSKGYWFSESSPSGQSCKVENFASQEELEAVIPHLPAQAILRDLEHGPLPVASNMVGDIPIDAVRFLMQRMAKFDREIDGFRRRHALAFDTLYEKLSHDGELTEWTLETLVPKIFGFPHTELPAAGLLALDKAIARHEGLCCVRLGATPEGYWARSKLDLRKKGLVQAWARDYQESAARAAGGKDVREELRKNPLGAFIHKAHRLIRKSREIRSPTTLGILGPSADPSGDGVVTAIETDEELSTTDRQIIRFIFESLQTQPPLVPDVFRTIYALIFRAIGAYPNLELGPKVGRLLLQELGAIHPWQDPRLNSYRNRLPGRGLWPSQERLLKRARGSVTVPGGFQDVAAHLRKDWGKLPVYCIDNAGAVEIDDGISVERDVDRVDCVWIRTHISNPAAYISRDDPIGLAARDVLTSTYTPSRDYRMMPEGFARGKASLAASRPVMTVSTLIQPDGSVADIQISLGTIRNVIKATPKQVAKALGETSHESATMVIGGTRKPDVVDDDDEETVSQTMRRALPDLRLISQYLRHHYMRRLSDWPDKERISRKLIFSHSNAWTSFQEEDTPLWPDKMCHWKGDPIIVVEGNRFPRAHAGFGDTPLVEHAMLLAGESAAKWCKDRQLPIYYHVATPHPDFPVSKLNQLDDTDFRLEPAGRMSAIPQPHWHLNMYQYTKITSPIRRFPDLVNQWQIQAYLQAIHSLEHQDGGLQSPDPLSRLPFSREELEVSAHKLGPQMARLRHVARLNTQRWIYIALFRALHFKEADLPETWDMKVLGSRLDAMTRKDHTGLTGFLLPFQVSSDMLPSEQGWEKEIKKSQFIPVKIELVDPEQERIYVRAVGPPTDEPGIRHPIHVQSVPMAQPRSASRIEQDQPHLQASVPP